MAVRHLSDQEIQKHLDGPHQSSAQVTAHLETCARCQTQLRQYQHLYSSLRQEPELMLRFDFADAVMVKLKSGYDATVSLPIWLAFISVTAGVIATLYLVGLEKVQGGLSVFGASLTSDWRILSTISGYLSKLHLNLGLLGLAVLIIIMMSIIDHFVFQSRHKLISFFK